METIHVKFDELTAMASECNNLEPGMNYMNFHNSSEDSQSIPSKSDLDNLFGPLYEEYYKMSSQEVSDDSAANTTDNDHTSSSSSIIVDQDDAPPVVHKSPWGIFICQSQYTMDILKKHGMEKCDTDYGFELIVYADADHAGCNDDCKSTSGGIQFLGDKLVSWSSKKQDCTAMSSAKAEYVSLSAVCAIQPISHLVHQELQILCTTYYVAI
ncbi:hypothetical protein Tco_0910296 [Tanacetum coccineum]|uniref:Uncharacterized protein n=1 Tax=Tanacetum coccineum TaxID=301880 RepID=A0ABQ5CSG5_9ASTR